MCFSGTYKKKLFLTGHAGAIRVKSGTTGARISQIQMYLAIEIARKAWQTAAAQSRRNCDICSHFCLCLTVYGFLSFLLSVERVAHTYIHVHIKKLLDMLSIYALYMYNTLCTLRLCFELCLSLVAAFAIWQFAYFDKCGSQDLDDENFVELRIYFKTGMA